MRSRLASLCLAALTFAPAALHAQGLVAIQNYSADFGDEQPLTFSLFSNGGYDQLDYKNGIPGTGGSIDSWFVTGGGSIMYTRPDQTTPFSFSLDSSVVHYVDGVPSFRDTFYNNRASVNFEHRFSERLKISNNFFAVAGSAARAGSGACAVSGAAPSLGGAASCRPAACISSRACGEAPSG